MITDEQLAAVAGEQLELDLAYPWEGGIVGLSSNTSGGQVFAPVGSTIGAVGQAFYLDFAAARYRLDLGATTAWVEGPETYFGDSGFTNGTPGVQQFEVVGAVGDCHGALIGWPGDTTNSVRVPVRAGFTTRCVVPCDVP